MGHSPTLNKSKLTISMLSTKTGVIFLAVLSLTAATSVEDKECVFLNGCSDQVPCCNRQFHCVNNGNGGGICQLWLNSAADQEQSVGKECVKSYHQGCQTAADCCQKGLMCAHFAGQPSGVCRHWLGASSQCLTSSDCPSRHVCQAGKCKPMLFEENVEPCNGAAGCPPRFVCVAGHCSPMLIEENVEFPGCTSSKDCPSGYVCRNGGKCRLEAMPNEENVEGQSCTSRSDCPALWMCHQGTCKPKFIMEGGCKSKADCPGRAVCHKAPGQETGYCKNLIFEDLVGQSQDVGCGKNVRCRTVADCPEHAHCGFNGCCQFW